MTERESAILRRVRTEYGKAIRKDYEHHKVYAQWKEIKTYEPRTDGICNCLTGVAKDNLVREYPSDGPERTRYLTPREALRLMGQNDDAIDRMMPLGYADGILWKMAGNSIVVNVLEAIFKGIYTDRAFKQYPSTLEDFL